MCVSEAKLGLSRDQQSRIDCVNELRLGKDSKRRRGALGSMAAMPSMLS